MGGSGSPIEQVTPSGRTSSRSGVVTFSLANAAAVVGYFAVQSRADRVRSFALPPSIRAAVRSYRRRLSEEIHLSAAEFLEEATIHQGRHALGLDWLREQVALTVLTT
jgi:hypothetical protein